MAQQFIPFEDDWDALSRLGTDALVPYRFEYSHPVGRAAAQQSLDWPFAIDTAESIVHQPG